MSTSSLKSEIVSLGTAKFLDFGLQFALPMVLARVFDQETYGRYMLIWLVVNTSLIFTTLNVPQSLFYFLPRSLSKAQRGMYIANSFIFLFLSGVLAAVIVNPWLPVLPERFVQGGQYNWFLSVFTLMWTLTQLVDCLPNAEERVSWQARIIIGSALLRAGILGGLGWYYRDLDILMLGMILFAGLRLLIIVFYTLRYNRLSDLRFNYNLLVKQLKYAVPFGIGAGLFMLRNQSDQWIAASLFSPADYSLFVIGMCSAPFFHLVRESINSATLARMSRLHADGQSSEMIRLFQKTNIHVAFIFFPMLVWFFIYSGDIIEVIFSARYREASDVMRVFLIGYLILTVECNNLFAIYEGGRFAMRLSLALLIPGVLISYFGGKTYGLWGPALGAVFFALIGETLKLRFVSRRSGTPISKMIEWPSWITLSFAGASAGVLTFQTMVMVSEQIALPLFRAMTGGAIVVSVYFLIVLAIRPQLLSAYWGLLRR